MSDNLHKKDILFSISLNITFVYKFLSVTLRFVSHSSTPYLNVSHTAGPHILGKLTNWLWLKITDSQKRLCNCNCNWLKVGFFVKWADTYLSKCLGYLKNEAPKKSVEHCFVFTNETTRKWEVISTLLFVGRRGLKSFCT